MSDIKVISATLLSGHNTVQITDSMISNDTIFEIYVSDPNIICNNIVVGGTTANITFDSKPTENTSVKVMVNNTSGVLKVPSADITDGETTQSAINTNVSNSISTLTSGKADLSTLNDRVPSETVLGGVLYHGTTGNEWKQLSGANINYDSDTTVNEKLNDIGDLNQLTTTVTTDLVSAINSIGGARTESGTVTRNATYCTGGTGYWVKVGKLVCVWLYDYIFNVATHTWNGMSNTDYISSGLPKKSNKNSLALIRSFENSSNVVRVGVMNNGDNAVLSPHWCTATKSTQNYYGMIIYESE